MNNGMCEHKKDLEKSNPLFQQKLIMKQIQQRLISEDPGFSHLRPKREKKTNTKCYLCLFLPTTSVSEPRVEDEVGIVCWNWLLSCTESQQPLNLGLENCTFPYLSEEEN